MVSTRQKRIPERYVDRDDAQITQPARSSKKTTKKTDAETIKKTNKKQSDDEPTKKSSAKVNKKSQKPATSDSEEEKEPKKPKLNESINDSLDMSIDSQKSGLAPSDDEKITIKPESDEDEPSKELESDQSEEEENQSEVEESFRMDDDEDGEASEDSDKEGEDSEENSEEDSPPPKKAPARPTRQTRSNLRRKVQESSEEESEEESPKKKRAPAKPAPKKKLSAEAEEKKKEKALDIVKNNIINRSDDSHLIELVLAKRHRRDVSDSQSQSQSQDSELPAENIRSPTKHRRRGSLTKVVEYLVKPKGVAYLHARWMTEEELSANFTNWKSRIQKYDTENNNEIDDEADERFAFNTDYLEIDRILLMKNNGKKILVKWKSLSYDDSTWESRSELALKVKNFEVKMDHYDKINSKGARQRSQESNDRPSPEEYDKDDIVIPDFRNNNQLKEYQEEGFNWLVHCWFTQRNTILADEMGLGKTIQAISILQYLFEERRVPGPFLVVAPMSTIEQWKRETEEWTNMNPVVFHGTADARNLIYDYEWFYEGQEKASKYYKFHVLITTYEVAMMEFSRLSNVPWQYLVVDEGHRLKNNSGKLFGMLRKYRVAHKLILTGTPLQNKVQELWTLINFLEPKKFSDEEGFLKEFGELKKSDQVESLHKKLGPYMLRRVKADVLKDIPSKEEILVEIELSSVQKTYYRAILERNSEFLTKSAAKSSLMNIMMQLRKCCNHPYLINGAEESILEGTDQSDEVLAEKLISSSSKFVFLDQLLARLRENGHRVLIFSQMTRVLDLLEDYMNIKNYPFERLDGGVGRTERQAAIDRFSNKSMDRFVFLLGTRAGGLGINLTIADTVVIFDSDWNPQNDVQAQCRAHRIGQVNTVKVYRLITRKTYEKTMFDVASKKLGLDRVVLGKQQEDESIDKALKTEEVERILKNGAYEMFNDEEADEGAFDLDKILERAKKVNWDEANGDSALSSFSKATFVAAEANSEVDINDKNFWEKVLPTFKTVARMKELLKDDQAFDTEEKKKKYVQDLGTIVSEFLARQESRSASSSFTSSMDSIAEISSLCKKAVASGKFDAADNSQIYKWMEFVEKPRLRKRAKNMSLQRNTSAFGGTQEDASDMNYIEESDLEEEKGNKKLTQAEKEQKAKERAEKSARLAAERAEKAERLAAKKGEWAKLHREKLRQTLLLYGWGRWDVITAQAKIGERNEEEVRCFCEALIDGLFPNTGLDHEAHKLIDLDKKEHHSRAYLGTAYQDTDREVKTKLKEISRTAKRGESVPISVNLSDYNGSVIISYDIFFKFSSQEWAINDVTRLYVLIRKASAGEIAPPELHVRGGLLTQQHIEEGLHIKAPGFAGDYELRIYSFTPDTGTYRTYPPFSPPVEGLNLMICGTSQIVHVQTSPVLLTPDFVNSVQKPLAQKSWLNKLSLLRGVCRLTKNKTYKTRVELGSVALRPPSGWWNDEDDQALLWGTYKYGYGKYDVMQQAEEFNWSEAKIAERSGGEPAPEKKEVATVTPKPVVMPSESDEEQGEAKEAKKEKDADEDKEGEKTGETSRNFPAGGGLNKRLMRLIEVTLENKKKKNKRRRDATKEEKKEETKKRKKEKEEKPEKDKPTFVTLASEVVDDIQDFEEESRKENEKPRVSILKKSAPPARKKTAEGKQASVLSYFTKPSSAIHVPPSLAHILDDPYPVAPQSPQKWKDLRSLVIRARSESGWRGDVHTASFNTSSGPPRNLQRNPILSVHPSLTDVSTLVSGLSGARSYGTTTTGSSDQQARWRLVYKAFSSKTKRPRHLLDYPPSLQPGKVNAQNGGIRKDKAHSFISLTDDTRLFGRAYGISHFMVSSMVCNRSSAGISEVLAPSTIYKQICATVNLQGKSRVFVLSMKVVAIAIVICIIAAAHAASISDDFPQPPYDFISSSSVNQSPTAVKCPDNCGNPNTPTCLWNEAIQDTCSATYAKRSTLAKRACTGGAQGCGPVCYSNGQGGYACGCVSCG
ncbi:chromodomain helicase DNA binding protein [Planoprotostelium fungivorum]|uniref:Chromodomain helicase DNA binding protein n=1 Tax=Planoprotostelium fungivorum TaxID=1890364 RepID=A0A2P6NQU5_9EUKA|nr:chromodomain helicase DNA binding protein [Planoprotostelium fungivorum]